MYQASDAYMAAIQSRTRTDKVYGTITFSDGSTFSFADEDLQSGSLSIDNQCVNGDEFEFGAVYAGQLSMTLMTDMNRYMLLDAKISLSYSLKLADGTFEEIPLGVYHVTEANRKYQYVSIKALDSMLLLNKDYDGTSVYGFIFRGRERP